MTPRLEANDQVDVVFKDFDALAHNELADQIKSDVQAMAPGSVTGIQGSWGRGKTDLVSRIFESASNDSTFPPPIWINPWQYGTPDLIRPVVLEMLRTMAPDKRSASDRVRRAARTLLRAGNAMLFKAVSVVAPFGEVIGAGEEHVDELLSGLFNESEDGLADPDPVYAMAERFRDLTEEYLDAAGIQDGRLLICVDDLDRCLPDHQIAMLEAIYFLTGARAKCNFIVALDPTLVQQAAHAHYKTSGFDSEQYLNKLFDLRLNLPPLSTRQIKLLLEGELARADQLSAKSSREEKQLDSVIERAFGVDRGQIGLVFADTMWLPELRNPRLIRRVFDRLWILARRLDVYDDQRLKSLDHWSTAVRWCALAERWPDARRVFQTIGDGSVDVALGEQWRSNAEVMCFWFGIYSRSLFTNNESQLKTATREAANMLARLPTIENAPDLGLYLVNLLLDGRDASLVVQVDHIMVEYGV